MITMRINKEFKISFLIFIPLGALNSYIFFNGTNLQEAILTGYLSAMCVFFVPILFKKLNQKKL